LAGGFVVFRERGMRMTWFGTPWDDPLNEECERQETPTGEACLWCEEPIESWSSGVVSMVVEFGRPPRRRPQHLECYVRQEFGSVGHQMGRCLCCGGSEEDPPGLSTRDAARAAVIAAALLSHGL
jgi:hypothetical protein